MTPDLWLRAGVLVVESMPGVVVRIRGDLAWDAVDGLLASGLRVRDGRIQPGVWLDADARPKADLLVARDGDDFWLIVEGAPGVDVLAALEAQVQSSGARFESLAGTHVRIGVHGPFAWEVMVGATSNGVLGMPYQTFLDLGDEGMIFRATKTGEYGYDWLVLRARHEETLDRLLVAAARMGMVAAGAFGRVPTGDPILDRAALENGFFSIRHSGVTALTPFELQLQSRVDRSKVFEGRDALLSRVGSASRQRAVTVTSPAAPVPGAPLFLGSSITTPVGHVLCGEWSLVLEVGVGLVLVDDVLACPGLELVTAHGAVLTVVSPPLLDNRSLQVDAQRHCFSSPPDWAPFRRPP